MAVSISISSKLGGKSFELKLKTNFKVTFSKRCRIAERSKELQRCLGRPGEKTKIKKRKSDQ